jgi:predicted TIM-barrel fold metal-dependent hydrolase
MELEFFDCNVSYGVENITEILRPVHTLSELQSEMARAGVKKAVVSRAEQFAISAPVGNQMLADDIRSAENLYGLWSVLPMHTHELPGPTELPALMKENRIIGWSLQPARGRFMLRGFALRGWLEVALQRRLPLFLDTTHGATLDNVADLLEEYPELTVVLTFANDWPNDRYLRPFLAEFANVYLDLAFLITDGGVESIVEEFGARRLVFGTAFPRSYFGANMLMVKHAQISDEDKAAIASGNLERIVREVAL